MICCQSCNHADPIQCPEAWKPEKCILKPKKDISVPPDKVKSNPNQVPGEGFGAGRDQRDRSAWVGFVAPDIAYSDIQESAYVSFKRGAGCLLQAVPTCTTLLLFEIPWDASVLLTVDVFLLTVRLSYLRWGNRK